MLGGIPTVGEGFLSKSGLQIPLGLLAGFTTDPALIRARQRVPTIGTRTSTFINHTLPEWRVLRRYRPLSAHHDTPRLCFLSVNIVQHCLMVNYIALKAEIAKPAYSGMTDVQIAFQINGATVQQNVDVPVGAIEGYLSLAGVLTAMEDWLAANPTPGAVRTAVKELLRTIGSPHVSAFNMSQPSVFTSIQGMLMAIEGVSLLTAQQVSDLMAMASQTIPQWSTFGNRQLDYADIAIARNS